MIPKIIHYCWYGKGKKDELTERCIASWKKYCPDYEIIEWNENNCDIQENLFAREAYECKKWAFVSDYFRLKKMYEYGGIYLDTDVELFQNLDSFLEESAFFGYADDIYIGTGTFGFEKNNKLCKKLLEYYEGRHFLKEDGVLDDIPNNQIYTTFFMRKLGLKLGEGYLYYGNNKIKIYPSDYFSPFKKRTIGDPHKIYNYNNFTCTENTYAIHYTVYSWNKNRSCIIKFKLLANQIIRLVMPRKVYFALKRKNKIKEMNKNIIL